MYKSTLLQLILIVIGLFTAVAGVQNLFKNFITLTIWTPELGAQSAVMGFLISVSYLLLAFFLVARSREWAEYISKISRLHGDFSINAYPGQVLYFILIGMGFFSLLREVPILLFRLYQGFAGKVERFTERMYRQDVVSGEDWILLTLNVLLPLIIVLFARQIAHYFANRMTEDPIEIVEHQSTDL